MLAPHPDNPNCPPDWRWERARWLNEQGFYARSRTEDNVVRLLRRYQSLYAKALTPQAKASIEKRFPGLFHAQNIRFDTSHNTRWIIEARLLTGEPIKNVALKTRIKEDIVRWYECVFFNVFDKLESADYICNCVIGKSIHSGISERDHDVLWKMLGYAGGPQVLDDVLTTIPNNNAELWYNSDIRGTIARKAAYAARTIPVAFNQETIFECYNKLREMEKANEAEGGVYGSMIDNVKSMLNSVGDFFSVSKAGIKDSGKLTKFDDQSVELRASEIIELTAERSVSATEQLADIKFPEIEDGQANQQRSRK